MADRISATEPRWEILRKLSEVLRSGAEKVKPYERIDPSNPESDLPVVSSTLESLGKGIEGWNYGDSPIDTRANTPLVNARTLDMAGALPVATGAKAAGVTAAHLLPALPMLYGDRGAGKLADALRQSIGRAELEHATGASLAEIAKKTQLFPYPGGLGKADSPQARWGFELQGKQFPHLDSMQENQLLGDIYEHPALYKAIPGLEYVNLHMGGDKGNLAAYAHYDDTAGGIGSINFNDKLLAKKDQSVFVQAMQHEINHAINAKTGQLGSLGHGVNRFETPAQAEHVYRIAQYLRKTDPQKNKLIDDLEKIAKYPGGSDTPEYTQSWKNSAGERLAEVDADRTVGQRLGGEIPDINRRVYAGRPVSDVSSLAALWSSLNPQGSVAKDTAYLLNILRSKKMID